MIWSRRFMSALSRPIGRHSWCKLHPAQLAFNTGMFKSGDATLANGVFMVVG
jgi:hypothetical protein